MDDDIFQVMKPQEKPPEEDTKIKPKYGPFDFVNSINSGKNLFEDEEDFEQVEKEYNPWLTNKAMSYYGDTIDFANMMNQYYNLDKKLQYTFLINIIRPRNRRSKWAKKEDGEHVEIVAKAYGYSLKKAEQALLLLSPNDIDALKQRQEIGGVKKR